jgi:N-acetyl-gamma-glutamyl-phosphate/LysW-gamma-L-alpha-aminoadipyl-6-phosphate reductase
LATTAILGLYPLLKNGIVDAQKYFIEGKVGSSAAGNKSSLASHHPERSGSLRSFQPTRHRHTAEIQQELTFDGVKPRIHFSATATDAVRGILSTRMCFSKIGWKRKTFGRSIGKSTARNPSYASLREGRHLPLSGTEALAGSNYCDVGFELDPVENRLVVLSALDN